MSVIKLDDFKKIDQNGEIHIPGVETVWTIKFDDTFRAKASLAAAQVQKIYDKQQSDDYQKELLAMPYSRQEAKINKDLADCRDACIKGLNSLLNDGKAGQEIYKVYNSVEVLAQIIGELNNACDHALDLDTINSKARMAKYDAD